MIKRILVGLAGTTYTPVAIQRAVTLAQAHDAEVTGVTVLDSSRVRCEGIGQVIAPNREVIRAERMEIARSQILQTIGDFKAACQTANIKHPIVEESGDAFTRLVDLARYHDLMVFGLRKRFVQMRLWPGVDLTVVTIHSSDDKANELRRAAEDYCRAHGYSVCDQSIRTTRRCCCWRRQRCGRLI